MGSQFCFHAWLQFHLLTSDGLWSSISNRKKIFTPGINTSPSSIVVAEQLETSLPLEPLGNAGSRARFPDSFLDWRVVQATASSSQQHRTHTPQSSQGGAGGRTVPGCTGGSSHALCQSRLFILAMAARTRLTISTRRLKYVPSCCC